MRVCLKMTVVVNKRLINSVNEKTLNTLEFPKVRERLASHTSFSAGRALALELAPMADPITAAHTLNDLIRETVTLVEMHMPDLDISVEKEHISLERNA